MRQIPLPEENSKKAFVETLECHFSVVETLECRFLDYSNIKVGSVRHVRRNPAPPMRYESFFKHWDYHPLTASMFFPDVSPTFRIRTTFFSNDSGSLNNHLLMGGNGDFQSFPI